MSPHKPCLSRTCLSVRVRARNSLHMAPLRSGMPSCRPCCCAPAWWAEYAATGAQERLDGFGSLWALLNAGPNDLRRIKARAAPPSGPSA
jgi:hypothetical protein